ncbi:L-arabinose transporter ATP-binding protein [compost metagenome]
MELLKDTVKELRDQGTSILFSTHRMEHVEELCRHITILDRSNTVVQGDIREIKKGYPREEVILRTAGEVAGLEGIAGVTAVQRQERGYSISISDIGAAQRILQQAVLAGEVEHFEIKEPTLNQIFIRAVGESNE